MYGVDLYQSKNRNLVENAQVAVQGVFPIASKDGRTVITATNVKIPWDGKLPPLGEHQTARQDGGSITLPVVADIVLERDGKQVQSLRNFKLGELPILTRLGTFMVNGGDYFTPNQLRLKPGTYTREMDNGQLETFINLKGRPLRLWMEPDKGVLKMGYGSSNVDFVPIMQAIGVSTNTLVDAFGGGKRGMEILSKNISSNPETHVDKFLRAIMERKQNRDLVRAGLVDYDSPVDKMSYPERITELSSWFGRQKVDAFVSRKTLGKEYTELSPETLLAAAGKLLAVSRREAKPDDRDSAEFKTLHSVEDMLPERITRMAKAMGRKLLSRLNRPDSSIARGFGKNWLNMATMGYFGAAAGIEGGLAHTAEAANPLAILSEHSKTTLMGEGGIGEERAVSNGARLFRPGSVGFIDPVKSPEGSQIGITSSLAVNAGKTKDNHLTTKMYKVEDGKITKLVDVTIEQASDSVVAYPETWNTEVGGKAKTSMVRANKDGEISTVSASSVDYVIPSGRAMLDHTSSAASFFQHTHPNRGMMAGKHLTQALPLDNRELPLSDIKDASGKSVLESLAMPFVIRSDAAGTVTRITKTAIYVTDSSGTVHKNEMFDSYAMQAKVGIEHIPVVKVGDKVTKGQLLADTNYSRDGKLALGVNVRTAYTPWKNAGNYEDAIVISESAAKKFGSMHIHRMDLELDTKDLTVGKRITQAQFPASFTSDNWDKLDDSGIIKEGSTVKPGDTVIAAVKKSTFDTHDRSSKNLSAIHRSLERPYSNASVTWDEDFPGVVYRVVRTPERIEVHLKTIETARVGDKLSMASAAKGTIAQIIADDKMPRDSKDRHIEVILNPHGVAGRINPSQTIEQAAGKLIRDHGETYDHGLFDGIDHPAELKKRLAKHGTQHTELLFDPETGKKTEEPVATGYNYMMKLDHPVRKKFSARERDGYTMDETPTSGKGRGGQSYDQLTTFALLGHNAHAILGESFGTRGVKNDEYWQAYQAGEAPPSPKVPFVFDKFRAMLNASGVDTKQHGNILHFLPMTEKKVKDMSNGEVTEASTLRARGSSALDMVEEKNGLFDPEITGGLKGDKWAHIKLKERVPHPLYEKVIRDLTGLKTAEYYGLLAHTMHLDPKTGKVVEPGAHTLVGEDAFKKLLSFDVDDKIKDIKGKLKTAVGSDANKLNRAHRYLLGLKETGLSAPDAYMTNVIPVIPPKYRPVIEMDGGALRVADSNLLYRDMVMANNQLAASKTSGVPDDQLKDARLNVYKTIGAVVGVNNALTHRDDREDAKGFIDTIKGKSNKIGLFQRMLARRRNDYSGRSTIEPDANLGIDEIGIPDDMAWKIYKPTIVRRMVLAGWSPADASNEVEKRTLAASQSLDAEMKERPVLYNRAPSLHKWSVNAAYAFRTPGKEITISPGVIGPTNSDYDGNCCIGSTLLTLVFNGVETLADARKRYSMRAESAYLISKQDSGIVVRMRIDEIPHKVKTKSLDKNGASVYAVPAGISVLTTDTDGRGVRFSRVTKYTVEDGCDLVAVTTSRGHDVTVSSNESLAVYDHETGCIARMKPAEAVGALCPIAAFMNPALPLGTPEDMATGWLVGAFCGDGFFMGDGYHVGFAKVDVNIRDRFETLMVKEGARLSGTYISSGSGKLAESTKSHYTGTAAVSRRLFDACYVSADTCQQIETSRACLRKTLPPIVFSSRKAALGALAGLLDTDGTVGYLNGKAKPQVVVQFSTSSPFLRDSVMDLLWTLGVRSSFSTTKPSKGRIQKHDAYTVIASIVDVAEMACELPVQNIEKREVLTALHASRDSLVDCRDPVPVPDVLFAYTADSTVFRDRDFLTYLRSVQRKCNFPRLSRAMAKRAIKVLRAAKIDLAAWFALVEDTTTRWDWVSAVVPVNTERVYDLEVPETKIFAVNRGLVIYDTMSVTVPITDAAKRESLGLMPSRNLMYDKDRSLAYGLDKDIITGLFVLTKGAIDSGKRFDTEHDAIAAYHDPKNNLRMDSAVTIKGQNGKPAIGWLMFKAVVPERYRVQMTPPIDGKKLATLLDNIAKQSPGDFSQITRKIAQAGFTASAAKGGITSSIDELSMDRTKVNRLIELLDQDVKQIRAKGLSDEKQNDALKTVHDKYVVDINKEVGKHLDEVGHGYSSMMKARISGKINPDQFRQMLASPLLMTDVYDNTVPAVITSNYGGGMKPSDYILTTPGARKGMVGKSLSTAQPGFLAKEIAGNMSSIRVQVKDCETQRGIEMPLKDDAYKSYDVDLLDRHLLRDIPGTSFKRNDPITVAMLSRLRDLKRMSVWVRSPMTCEAIQAPCQMCAGRDASGALHPIGSNIGLNYGQTVSERSTQLILKSFHSGGTLGSGDSLSQGFARLRELLSAPELVRNQGTLSDVDGRVHNIRMAPQGGEYVTVLSTSGSPKEHYVASGRNVTVKIGDMVKVGDPLSDGSYRPQEIAQKKSMLDAQKYVVTEARKAYQSAGAVVRMPVLEVVAAGMMRYIRITDDGDTDGVAIGDVVPEQRFEALKKTHPKMRGVPELPGISSKPLLSTDLMERLNFQRLEDAVREVPAMGGKSDLSGASGSPLAGFAYGINFRPGEAAYELKTSEHEEM